MITEYSKCGNNCTSCPSFKNNLLTDGDRRDCSQGWYTYHGFRLNPDKLITCDGCQPVGQNGNGTRYINCLIRRCALHNEIQNCAYCSSFPCDVLTNRVLGQEWLDRLMDRLGSIPEDDYDIFVQPYLGIIHLDAVRAALDPGEIKQAKDVEIEYRLVAFPDGLTSTSGFEDLHMLLQRLNAPVEGLSYAQAETQKEKRRHLLKIIWAFGMYGEFDPKMSCLILNHKVYLAQKIHSGYDRVLSNFVTLSGFGVRCEVIPLIENHFLTPKGALRRQGARETDPPWEMKMTIDERVGGREVLNALKRYAGNLDGAFGKSAYRKFGRADMQVMLG